MCEKEPICCEVCGRPATQKVYFEGRDEPMGLVKPSPFRDRYYCDIHGIGVTQSSTIRL